MVTLALHLETENLKEKRGLPIICSNGAHETGLISSPVVK